MIPQLFALLKLPEPSRLLAVATGLFSLLEETNIGKSLKELTKSIK